MKRVVKRSIVPLMVFAMVFSAIVLMPIVAYAEAGETILRFVVGSTTYTRNGQSLTIEAAPFNQDGRVMVPLRAVGEALNAEFAFENNVAYVRPPGAAEIRLPIGEALPGGMGTPVIVEGRTFVPLGFIANEIDATPRWDGDASAAYIYVGVADAPATVVALPPADPVDEEPAEEPTVEEPTAEEPTEEEPAEEEPAPPVADADGWSMTSQMAAWRAAGLSPGGDLGGSYSGNPWNDYLFFEGYDGSTMVLNADGSLRFTKPNQQFCGGLFFVIPSGASEGDVARFYFTVISASEDGNGIMVRSVGSDRGNYAQFRVPAGQENNWPLTTGESHVIEWPLTAACLNRGFLHLTVRFGQSATLDVTEITFS